jgi:EAL domain-containing protein (putative c-di-GMP-specific phosphodiesterase class I)
LTENVLQTGPNTIEVLQRLRACGIGVALDDFGTGFSSLTSLEQLPLTRVKLDRSLVASIDTSPRSFAIAHAIIGLCNSLGLKITAEGIERREQLLPLLNHRAMHLQGYLLARPVSSDELLPLIADMPARMELLFGSMHTTTATLRRVG